jgi:hypothetical protein
MSDKYFKAFIRVVKSLNQDSFYIGFGPETIIKEPLILANDKNDVKSILLEKYPQFFQNGKIYEKETKDTAQFFYVVIYPLYQHEIDMVNEGQWECSYCGHIHADKYSQRPLAKLKLFPDMLFCRTDDETCLNNYSKEYYKGVELPDDENYIKADSLNYIYKITEKLTGKCYVGKTRNEPFFRWWNHLRHSNSPFGIYLRNTKLSDWTFEVLEVLPSNFADSDIFLIESNYIVKFNSVSNGFNSMVSNKKSLDINSNQASLF